MLHTPEDGGRALGEVFRTDDTVRFEACWDTVGKSQWVGGDGDVVAEGSESGCTAPNPW